MDVDPPGPPESPPEVVPSSTGLKRLQEDAPEDAASTSKCQKPDEPQEVDEGKPKAEEGGEAGEASTPGEKGKRKEREKERKSGGRNKRQRGKKGEEKDFVRNRRRGTRPEGEEAPAENGESKAPRLPKRQCALLIGFCGDGFNGMQIQPDPKTRTIEGVLFDALIKVGAVSKDNSDNPTKVKLGRAARTDAGVHAAGNVVSMKLINIIPGVPDLVSRINKELPPEIRLWSILRVQNSFNARTTCDSRKYTYFFPSYLMIPPKPGSGLSNTLKAQGTECPAHPFWEDVNNEQQATAQDDLQRKRTPPHLLEEMYGPRQIFIPKMPALGLLLEYPIFESYSKRVAGVNEKLQTDDPEYRPIIDFEVHRAQLDEFKQNYIYSKMRSIEDQFGIFDGWVRSIDAYAGHDLEYLNPKGVIPASAVIKRGEYRNNPFREKKRFDATSFPAGTSGVNALTIEEEESSEDEETLPLDKEELADLEG
ncbi:hypothetical protein GSI_12764 [Ganoderma sinense ZZ0214-1]|uniref:Pseudouridine synthase I TruA alpha/beta domain-containing protein n=1 Tax=Ganoderma sinense ZZ0214-1 TaxID=1077348 RepID=A0A2G8RTM9_9APHY|nr:hypothetical protein GSI_12764 [Ganoderma sinense ZZ0214-1]